MFKVMIIDDDEQVRNRLKSIIDWKNIPIELVCEAADSDTALELYLLHRPKIIVSDINIPIISGLELAEILRKEDPDLQFIIITGYNDFELVRKSVELGAVDLLSKPILPEAINKSLNNVVSLFLKKQQEQSSVDRLTQLVANNLPQMQEIFIANLVSNPPEDIASLESQFRQLNIPLKGSYFVVVMLAIRSSATTINHEALLLLLRDKLTANLKDKAFSALTYIDSHSRLNCIISVSQKSPDNTLEEILTRTKEELHFTTDTQLFVGIGPTVETPGLLYESRSGALTALNYQCVLGNTSVMHYKNMEQLDTVFHSQETIQLRLIQLFRENKPEDIGAIIHNHINVLSTYGSGYQQSIQNFLFEYVHSITSEALRLGLTMERIDSYVPTIMQLVQNTFSNSTVDSVLKLTQQILSCLFQRHTNEGNRLISMAKEYIQNNLHDEGLSLESVSDYVSLSRIYFCKLFHQVEGISFNAYLKRERINKAKDLLQNTSMKIFEVSNAVGFSNAKYFSFAFKQTVGITPGDFQKLPRD